MTCLDQLRAKLDAGEAIEEARFIDADWSDLDLLSLGGFAGLKINQSQQHILLRGLNIDVHPEPE